MRPSDLITPQMLPPAQAEALPALPPQAEARGSGAKAPEPTAGAWGRGQGQTGRRWELQHVRGGRRAAGPALPRMAHPRPRFPHCLGRRVCLVEAGGAAHWRPNSGPAWALRATRTVSLQVSDVTCTSRST